MRRPGQSIPPPATAAGELSPRCPTPTGVTRAVYEDADGRPWVAGYDGERVYGVWLMPADEPAVDAGEG